MAFSEEYLAWDLLGPGQAGFIIAPDQENVDSVALMQSKGTSCDIQ